MGCGQSQPLATTSLTAEQSGSSPAIGEVDAQEQAAVDEARDKGVAAAEQLLAANKGKSYRDTYVRGTLTSYGASCKVFKFANKFTQEPVAIKTVLKSKQAPDLQRRRVLQEVACMHMLQSHPHSVKLIDAYEDDKSYHIIMELLKGGELFDHISKAGRLTEALAANVLRSLCMYLAHAHSLGIAHMDLKPENIMFDSQGAEGVLKVIDYGSAEFVGPTSQIRHAFGTVRYSSPEMARDRAGQKSDVWSAGVVVYHILAGRVPFLKDTDHDTLKLLIKDPQVKFGGSVWRSISLEAKDCLKAMLQPDPHQRPTALQVLSLPWLAGSALPQQPLDASVLQQLQVFADMSRSRRLMLGVAAASLTGQEAAKLMQQFLSFDSDLNGTLSFEEVAAAAKQAAPEISEADLRRVFAALDVDGTGTVDSQEFIAGVINTLNPGITAVIIEASFRKLDRGSKGFLTKAQFKESLVAASPASMRSQFSKDAQLEIQLSAELDAEFDSMDENHDGLLTLDEYSRAMSPHPHVLASALSAVGTATTSGGTTPTCGSSQGGSAEAPLRPIVSVPPAASLVGPSAAPASRTAAAAVVPGGGGGSVEGISQGCSSQAAAGGTSRGAAATTAGSQTGRVCSSSSSGLSAEQKAGAPAALAVPPSQEGSDPAAVAAADASTVVSPSGRTAAAAAGAAAAGQVPWARPVGRQSPGVAAAGPSRLRRSTGGGIPHATAAAAAAPPGPKDTAELLAAAAAALAVCPVMRDEPSSSTTQAGSSSGGGGNMVAAGAAPS